MKLKKWKKQRERIRWGILIGLVCLAGVTYSCNPSPNAKTSLQLSGNQNLLSQTEQNSSVQNGMLENQEQQTEHTSSDAVYVHVTGYVKKPGVYKLDAQGRVYQAIEAAGGFKKKADQTALNMAEKVIDGQKIYVPCEKKYDDTATGKEQDSSNQSFSKDTTNYVTQASQQSDENDKNVQEQSEQQDKININTASKEDLMKLSGIGETKAEAIIAYRESHGAFLQITDLMLVDGIKEGSFSKVKEHICVE